MKSVFKLGTTTTIAKALMSLALVAAPMTAQSEVLYQVSTTGAEFQLNQPPSQTSPTGRYEYGDDVILNTSLSEVSIKRITFDYLAEVPSGETRTMVFRIYANDGADYDPARKIIRKPGYVLYESAPIQASNGSFTVAISNLPEGGIVLPRYFTWAVEFVGFTQTAGNRASLLSTDLSRPNVGTSYNDYWVNTATSGWVLNFLSSSVSNFVCSFES
jgi:hypothetical protein